MLLAEAEERLSMERLAHAEFFDVLRVELQGAREATAAARQVLDATSLALRAEQRDREDAEAAHFQECLEIAGACAAAEEALAEELSRERESRAAADAKHALELRALTLSVSAAQRALVEAEEALQKERNARDDADAAHLQEVLDATGERQEVIDEAEEAQRVERAAREEADARLVKELQDMFDCIRANQRVCAEGCALAKKECDTYKGSSSWQRWWPGSRSASGKRTALLSDQVWQEAQAKAEQVNVMAQQCLQRIQADAAENDFQREQRLARLRPHVLTAEERAEIRRGEGELLLSVIAVHSLAAWSPRWWAPVCTTAARSVMGSLHVWTVSLRDESHDIRRFRSRGRADEQALFGPEAGVLWSAKEEFALLEQQWRRAVLNWPDRDGVALVYTFLLRRIKDWLNLIEYVDVQLAELQSMGRRSAGRMERIMELLGEVVDQAELRGV